MTEYDTIPCPECQGQCYQHEYIHMHDGVPEYGPIINCWACKASGDAWAKCEDCGDRVRDGICISCEIEMECAA